VGALKRLVHPRFFDLDVAALARGRQEFRESASDDYLWGVWGRNEEKWPQMNADKRG
jgi:hypothetical protein